MSFPFAWWFPTSSYLHNVRSQKIDPVLASDGMQMLVMGSGMELMRKAVDKAKAMSTLVRKRKRSKFAKKRRKKRRMRKVE